MKKPIKFRKDLVKLHGGFKCDRPGCGYVSPNEPPEFDTVDDYIEFLRSYLDVLCPLCGSPLLTQKDFEAAVLVVKTVHNPVFTWLNDLVKPLVKEKKILVNFDGTGNPNVKVEEKVQTKSNTQ